MERNNLIKKGLVVAVILLFIGVAFAPSINANISKASIESELVEITTEVCGINGVKPNTVSLSKEDVDEVEKLIDDIERRLDNVETREETVEIFNEAVVELDKYGLLGGLSVKQAQRLVTVEYQNSRFIKLFERLFVKYQFLDNDSNYLCLVAGQTSYTIRMSFPILRVISFLLWALPEFGFVLPVSIFSVIYFGKYWWSGSDAGGSRHERGANGWVSTLGLNGNKSWAGDNLYGYLPNLVWELDAGNFGQTRWGGVAGFTGIIIKISNEEISFLGSALKVKLGTGRP